MEVDVDVDEEVEEEEEEEETSGTVMKTLSEQHLTEDHMRLRLPGWREGSDVALKYWYINQLGPGWKKTLLQWWERCKESGDGRPFRYFEEGRHRNVVCLGQQAINKKTSSAWKNNRCACWDCAHNANPKRPCFRLVYLGRNPSNWIDGLDRIVEVLPWDDQGQSLNGMSAFQYWDAPGEKKKSKKRR
ncbi:hypothetical protein PRZ48_014824 [Zasmidium cellare]|uniref:Uncharacterized protein n=1 Tax=Zasmidium cellare TaxID=395010 RepID=A0ABR0DZU8_ZASCE|nr:hypothetical protein PRZ48_014824 [Zasmidium cellare]